MRIVKILIFILAIAPANAAPPWLVQPSTTGKTTAELAGQFLLYQSTSANKPSLILQGNGGRITATGGVTMASGTVKGPLSAASFTSTGSITGSSLTVTGNASIAGTLSGPTVTAIGTATGTIAANLSAETTRATARENAIGASTGTISASLTTETARAAARENAIGASTGTVAASVTAESSRATVRENALGTSTGTIAASITAETSRATATEASLQTRISAGATTYLSLTGGTLSGGLSVTGNFTAPYLNIYGALNGIAIYGYGQQNGIIGGTGGQFVGEAGPFAGQDGYGVSGVVTGSGYNTAYGIYGRATGALANWAGYFDGNVKSTGTLYANAIQFPDGSRQTAASGSGSGDMVLSATQTVSGGKTFAAPVTLSSTVYVSTYAAFVPYYIIPPTTIDGTTFTWTVNLTTGTYELSFVGRIPCTGYRWNSDSSNSYTSTHMFWRTNGSGYKTYDQSSFDAITYGVAAWVNYSEPSSFTHRIVIGGPANYTLTSYEIQGVKDSPTYIGLIGIKGASIWSGSGYPRTLTLYSLDSNPIQGTIRMKKVSD